MTKEESRLGFFLMTGDREKLLADPAPEWVAIKIATLKNGNQSGFPVCIGTMKECEEAASRPVEDLPDYAESICVELFHAKEIIEAVKAGEL